MEEKKCNLFGIDPEVYIQMIDKPFSMLYNWDLEPRIQCMHVLQANHMKCEPQFQGTNQFLTKK